MVDDSKSWNGVKTNKSIIFDLDLSLIHTFSKIKTLEKLKIYSANNVHLRKRIYTIDLHDVVDEPGTGVYSRMWGAYRPGWEKFHNFCRKYFEHVGIWSAGQPHYVDAIVDILFPDPDFQPIVVYNWNHCHINGDNICKPLDKLFNDDKIRDILRPEDTYILDDREDTFSLNEENGILIPAYEPNPTADSIMKEDMHLQQLEEWLSQPHVYHSQDIRDIDKADIFRKTVITKKKMIIKKK